MLARRRLTSVSAALYVNAALLAGLIVVLLWRGSDRLPTFVPIAAAQETGVPTPSPVQQNIGAAAGLVIVPGQFTDKLYGCYVMDVDAQTLCAYQYYPGEHQLRLVAARSFRYDHQLSNFNTGAPEPLDVKRMVEQEKAGLRGSVGGTTDAPPTH